MTTVVVSAYRVASKPEVGGHFWVYLQYIHGLRQLGCDVFWLEHFPRCGDSRGLDVFFRRMERYGLAGKALLYQTIDKGGDDRFDFLGATAAQAEGVFLRADLLVNFHYAIDPHMLNRFQRTALVDIDPGLLQFWISRKQLVVPPHDFYLTIGETVGTSAGRMPDCGLPWVHIRPVVCLDLWPYAYDPSCRRFTTVSTWLGGEYVTNKGRILYENDKRVSFLRFADLPTRTPSELELALFLKGPPDAGDREFLERRGWRVRHALEVASTPARYQSYVQRSRGEFSCAKPSYIDFQSAWVSDRTLCYLASGKPAVVQDTGPSSFLPTGEGLFRFSTVEEAAAALAAVDADYERHCRAARGIAEAFFDAQKVLPGLVSLIDAPRLQSNEKTGPADQPGFPLPKPRV
jgi:hypothetical protein